jgi:hypothetical protein
MLASAAASASESEATDLPKYNCEAASTPRTLGPNSTRFRYSSRIRRLVNVASRRTASAITSTFARTVRGAESSVRASCCVSVEAPDTTRPSIKLLAAARAIASGSMPGWA